MEKNTQEDELLKQIDNLKKVNDKLLHKYVEECLKPLWDNVINGIWFLTFLVAIGIIANQCINLSWPVIVAVWLVFFLFFICEIYYTYPISSGQLAVTNSAQLQQVINSYRTKDLFFTVIFMPAVIGVFIWLAFEVRSALTKGSFYLNYGNALGELVFWFIIVILFFVFCGSIGYTYFTFKKTEKLVTELGEIQACIDIA